jgi:hypothetical protein
MTKTIYETNILEIKGIRTICDCGFEFKLPTSKPRASIDSCPCCRREFPADGLSKTLDDLFNLADSLKNKRFSSLRMVIDSDMNEVQKA